MCAPIKAPRVPVLTGAVWWLAIPLGGLGGTYVLHALFGWAALLEAGVTTVAVLGILSVAAQIWVDARKAEHSERATRRSAVPVRVRAWVDAQDVWPSDEQARIEAGRRAQVEAERVPVLDASRVWTAAEVEAEVRREQVR